MTAIRAMVLPFRRAAARRSALPPRLEGDLRLAPSEVAGSRAGGPPGTEADSAHPRAPRRDGLQGAPPFMSDGIRGASPRGTRFGMKPGSCAASAPARAAGVREGAPQDPCPGCGAAARVPVVHFTYRIPVPAHECCAVLHLLRARMSQETILARAAQQVFACSVTIMSTCARVVTTPAPGERVATMRDRLPPIAVEGRSLCARRQAPRKTCDGALCRTS